MEKLQTISVRKWLQSRCHAKTKEQYLSLKETIEYENQLRQIFAKIDENNLGYILKVDLQTLFMKYGMEISAEELDSYIKIANTRSGRKLTINQFKRCVQDENASKFLQKIVNRSNSRNKDNQYPPQITKIINQIDYLKKRETIVSKISNEKIAFRDRVNQLSELVNLSSQIDLNTRCQTSASTRSYRINRTKSTNANNYTSLTINQSNYASISTSTTTTNKNIYKKSLPAVGYFNFNS